MNYLGRNLCPCSSWCQNRDQGVGVEITGTGCKLSDLNSGLRSQVFLKALWKIITISQDLDRGADPTLSPKVHPRPIPSVHRKSQESRVSEQGCQGGQSWSGRMEYPLPRRPPTHPVSRLPSSGKLVQSKPGAGLWPLSPTAKTIGPTSPGEWATARRLGLGDPEQAGTPHYIQVGNYEWSFKTGSAWVPGRRWPLKRVSSAAHYSHDIDSSIIIRRHPCHVKSCPLKCIHRGPLPPFPRALLAANNLPRAF